MYILQEFKIEDLRIYYLPFGIWSGIGTIQLAPHLSALLRHVLIEQTC